MKSKKIIILVITISFPVLLYLFLRFFGQNSYNLPIYFAEEGYSCLDDSAEFTNRIVSISQSMDTIQLANAFQLDGYKLVIFPNYERDNQPFKNELSRTFQALEDRVALQLLAFYPQAVNFDLLELPDHPIASYAAIGNLYDQLLLCNFKLPTANYAGLHPMEDAWPANESIVLIDEDQNIRGYFNGFETKDVDRLILEINVLLSTK